MGRGRALTHCGIISLTLPCCMKFKPLYGLSQSQVSSSLQLKTLRLMHFYHVYSSPRAAITKHHRLGGLHNRKVSSHTSGGWKSEIKVSGELIPFESLVREGFVPSLSPWLTDVSISPERAITPSSLCTCLCPNFLFLEDTSHVGLGPP